MLGLKTNRFGAVLVAATVAAAVGLPARARADTVLGVVMPDGAKKVGENRYRAVKDWDHTVNLYRRLFPPKGGYIWRDIASTPKVRALNIENVRGKGAWEGLNIYETRGKVFVYVIPVDKGDKTEKSSRDSGKKQGKK